MSKKLLIVGAGGFIGGFIAQEGLRRGFETYVAIRDTTSRRYLNDSRLHFIILDYDNEQSLEDSLNKSLPNGEKWDYIIYNLGATKCANFLDFNRINFLYLRSFVEILTKIEKIPHRFLFMSSLSAVGPVDEENYTPITSKTIPNPNTRYGLSKIKAETYLESIPDFPYIIFRPTGVYGPHEKDYLMMIKSIDSHFDFGVGYRKQLLTFIYVEDLVNAMFDAYEVGVIKKKYIISENACYTQKQFRKIVANELGVKWVIPLKLPMWIVYIASVIAEKWAATRLKASTLNRDKFKIMKQRNWSCDVSEAKRDFNFNPKFSLKDGIKETIKAYLLEKRNNMNKTISNKKFPIWVKIVIIIVSLPVFMLPLIISQCNEITYEGFKLFLFLYPIYIISSAIMAWISYKTRPEISIVLIILMLFTHIAIWMIPNYSYSY